MNINTLPLLAVNLKPFIIAIAIFTVIVIILLVVLTIVGKKLQTKQDASQEAMKAASQTMSMLVIDKKRIKLKEAGLPKIVVDQTPKYLRGSKVPIVKAKIGPKIMTLMCDEKIFEYIPVKKEIKAVVSGIYIMDVKGSRNGLEARTKKLSFMKRMRIKLLEKAKQK